MTVFLLGILAGAGAGAGEAPDEVPDEVPAFWVLPMGQAYHLSGCSVLARARPRIGFMAPPRRFRPCRRCRAGEATRAGRPDGPDGPDGPDRPDRGPAPWDLDDLPAGWRFRPAGAPAGTRTTRPLGAGSESDLGGPGPPGTGIPDDQEQPEVEPQFPHL